ncbi:5053_t:CDS:2, partial [Scutellospora calospora]
QAASFPVFKSGDDPILVPPGNKPDYKKARNWNDEHKEHKSAGEPLININNPTCYL